MTRNNLLK